MRKVRINFGLKPNFGLSESLSDRWDQTSVSAIAETKWKNRLQFSLIFGLRPYFGLSLWSQRKIIQKVKSPIETSTEDTSPYKVPQSIWGVLVFAVQMESTSTSK